jgi:serine/threonine-protein kinase RsbW
VVRIDLDLPNDAESVSLCRRMVRTALRETGVDQEKAADIELVVSEATTNAVRHAEGGNRYRVLVEISPQCLTLQVADQGDGFTREEIADPDPEEPGGKGLWLMEQLADEVVYYDIADDGVCLRAQFRLQPRHSGQEAGACEG